MDIPLCKCGCGEPAKAAPKKPGGFYKFAEGHRYDPPGSDRATFALCACGCGGKTKLRPGFRRPNKWLLGHSRRIHGHDSPQGRSRGSYLFNKYGLTRAAYDAMVLAQGDRCAVCGRADKGRRAARSAAEGWCVDHDHETGKVRALLCFKCNSALGMAEDKPERLRALADYIERHK